MYDLVVRYSMFKCRLCIILKKISVILYEYKVVGQMANKVFSNLIYLKKNYRS